MCQGCRQVLDREKLIKITKIDNKSLKINPNSKELGRSIYVCKKLDCIKALIKKKRIKTGLKFYDLDEIEKLEHKLLELFSDI